MRRFSKMYMDMVDPYLRNIIIRINQNVLLIHKYYDTYMNWNGNEWANSRGGGG